MKHGRTALVVLLLFAGLVLVNYLASTLPVRFDATADSIYTLSPGTRTILQRIEDPVTLDFYFSRDVGGVPVAYKNYAARVEEMLRQYRRAAHGKIILRVIDPAPDTPAEDQAAAAGVTPAQLPNGDKFYFGLVATQADQQQTLTAFTPQREPFLEYDISSLLYRVQQTDKPKLGLITSLPLQPQFDLAAMQSGQMPASQFVIDQWSQTYDIVPVEAAATKLPAHLDVLAIVHPENLSAPLRYAIDQYILAGHPVFLAVDPMSQYFAAHGGQAAMYGMPPANVSSDLPQMLKAYGIGYDPTQVVGDLTNATQVQGPDGAVIRYPVWPTFTRADLDARSPATAQLNSLLFVDAGSIAPLPGGKLTFTPLIKTSPQTGEVPAASLSMGSPESIVSQIVPDGAKVVAALVTGKFTTAFPDGPPKARPAADAGPISDPKAATKPAAAAPSDTGLKTSKDTSTLIVVADTDWLLDDYSVRQYSFLGQNAAEPINDNLAFAANALDYLGGSDALLSIRGKGNSIRPFTVVQHMEAAAQQKYQQQLDDLESRLNDVQQKLSALQGKQTSANQLIASPEAARTIANFEKQEAQMRAQRRQIRAALRANIEALGHRLYLVNLLAVPILLAGFGWWFHRRRLHRN